MPPGSHAADRARGHRGRWRVPARRTAPGPPRAAGPRARTSRRRRKSMLSSPVTASWHSAPRRIASATRIAIAVPDAQVAGVGLEQPGAGAQVAGLEQRHHHGQQREGAHVVVGAGDEREDLELGLDRRAVVGEHVHPVVLREQRRGRAGRARGTRSPRAWYISQTRRPSVSGGSSPSARHRAASAGSSTDDVPGARRARLRGVRDSRRAARPSRRCSRCARSRTPRAPASRRRTRGRPRPCRRRPRARAANASTRSRPRAGAGAAPARRAASPARRGSGTPRCGGRASPRASAASTARSRRDRPRGPSWPGTGPRAGCAGHR